MKHFGMIVCQAELGTAETMLAASRESPVK
jgi:hypothetical protein